MFAGVMRTVMEVERVHQGSVSLLWCGAVCGRTPAIVSVAAFSQLVKSYLGGELSSTPPRHHETTLVLIIRSS